MQNHDTTPQEEQPDAATQTLHGVPAGAEALAIRQIAEASGQHVLHICHSDKEADTLEQGLSFFFPKAEILQLPAWDCLPYDRASPHASIMAERIACLSKLAIHKTQASDTPLVILTTASTIIQRLPCKAMIANASLHIATGKTLNRSELETFFQTHGYRRSGKVMEPGEYAIRGNIIDIFPSGYEEALRIDLFGDEIESITHFDTLSQRSSQKIKEITLYPASEVMLNDSSTNSFRTRYRELFGAAHRDDALYHAISAGQHYSGMEHWLPLFYEQTDSIWSYLPQNCQVSYSYQLMQTLTDRSAMVDDYYAARKDHAELPNNKKQSIIFNPLPTELLYITLEYTKQTFSNFEATELSPFIPDSAAKNSLNIRSGKQIFHLSKTENKTPIELLCKEIGHNNNASTPTLICCHTAGSMDRINKLLAEHDTACTTITKWDQIAANKGTCYSTILPLTKGFTLPHSVLYSEQDVFGHKIIQTRKKKQRTADAFMQEAAAFEMGELLVHKDHGIGKFDGLITMDVSGVQHDCLKLLYRGDDRLFLPVENIDLLHRFGSDGDSTELDKLGAGNWQSRKAALKERIKLSAEELMKTAAARQLHKAPILTSPPGLYEEFCARFPYAETDDQDRSINEVAEDLCLGRPMDRLICGDVGFGKTEVALRAAFIAATAENTPVQVALICPTTLLARQHFKNFLERFEGTGLRIAQLSRLTTSAQAKLNREGLLDGSVDIVIGTHALLSKQVKFANLGLLIVDEEQHFGVKQKEQLKQLKNNVHILTLSATPIPRTLQMALSGVRELSLITTPPVDRLAIRSFVLPYDPIIIREALEREMHRGGQVFYVTPRIADLAELKFRISELVPQARVAMLNGQMAAGLVDQTMNDFYEGKYDILLSTAIIESGIDIPTANTIIINKADKFGLAQLYQMRGRVGRGKTRAYAYFTLPHHNQLTANATKRLEVMQTLDTLGAGFSLASHDMDIRGFGNMVGEEQSGHVREVGTELYQHMLEEAVREAKQKISLSDDDSAPPPAADWSPQVNVGISVLIPESYVEDLGLRLSLYRRLSMLDEDAEIDSFAAEMVDRFGPLPNEVNTLLGVLRIKRDCRKANIERIDTGPKGVIITLKDNEFPAPEKLIGLISRHSNTMKIRPDQKLFTAMQFTGESNRLAQVQELIARIGALLPSNNEQAA